MAVSYTHLDVYKRQVMSGEVIAAILVGLSVLSLFIAIRQIMPSKDPVEDRLREYGLTE